MQTPSIPAPVATETPAEKLPRVNWWLVRHRAGLALEAFSAKAKRAAASGPMKCARLALAAVAGVLAVACLPALVLAALLILAPIALVVVILGGLALAAWPYSLPKLPNLPTSGRAT